MTITLPTEPEYPNEQSALSKWLGPKRKPDGNALNQLTEQDASGIGGNYARNAQAAANNKRIAISIGELWGVQYSIAGEGVRATMRQVARQLIIECEGDVEAADSLIEAMRKDERWAAPTRLCQNVYSVVRRIGTYRAKRLAERQADYTGGKTAAELEAERQEHEELRAERLRRITANREEAAREREAREQAARERWEAKWGAE